MTFLPNLLHGIAFVLNSILNFFLLVIIARVVISWLSADPYNPIVRFVLSVTEPLLQPLRRRIPPIGGALDITPMILILLIYFLQIVLVGSLEQYAGRL